MQQLSSGFLLLLGGMVWGGLLDGYRLFRRELGKSGCLQKRNVWITHSGDFLFWLAVSVFLLPLIYWSTWLRLRFYVWLLLILGALVYQRFFSRTFLMIVCCLLRKEKKTKKNEKGDCS